jgi:hypothetical protein
MPSLPTDQPYVGPNLGPLQPNRNALPVVTDPMGNATGVPSDNQLPSDSVIQQFVDSMSQRA